MSERVLRTAWHPVPRVALVAGCLLASGCSTDVRVTGAPSVDPTITSAPRPTLPTTTSTTTPTTSSSTSTTSTSTTSTSTTTSTTTTSTLPPVDPSAPALTAAFRSLADGNAAVSMTVYADGRALVRLASGTTNGGAPMTPDTPMVIASVSKLVTALTIARLVQQGELTVEQPVPWEAMGFAADPAWASVTVRDLLDHTSGMPIARKSWLDDPGGCAIPLAAALAGPPSAARGTWVYSNGNYCALGLLIELVTGERYDTAAYRLVFTPAAITGPHLTIDGSGPDDAPYAKGVARFDRLGGAGQWIASTDDIATLLGSVTEADRQVLMWPGVITDQYGWGHTGTVDGAMSCAWVIAGGRSVIAVTVSGGRPGTGGRVCDAVLPAAAADLGLPHLGEPERTPD